MSEKITQDLKSTGVAQVLVFLKSEKGQPMASKSVKASLGDSFRRSEFSIASSIVADSSDLTEANVPKMQYYPNLGVALGTVDREGLTALRSKDDVEKVSGTPPLRLIRPYGAPAAASLVQDRTWGIEALGVKDLWDQGLRGKNLLIGHLDTGLDGSHATFKKGTSDDAVFSFAEFDRLGRQINPSPAAYDSADHGTHTAATIAGRPVSGKYIGVAPEARLASAMVIEGGNAVARVLGGMDWAIGQGVRILSMSLGFSGWWTDFLPLVRIIRARGILPVFAVGNEYASSSRSPGNYPQALSVGACNEQMEVCDFSSSQFFKRKKDSIVPDLVAPGNDVISAKPGGGYQMMSGTSMATPHIAGLAALLWEAKPDASAAQIEKAIYDSCKLFPKMAQMRANRGLPNASKALSLLMKKQSPAAAVKSPTP